MELGGALRPGPRLDRGEELVADPAAAVVGVDGDQLQPGQAHRVRAVAERADDGDRDADRRLVVGHHQDRPHRVTGVVGRGVVPAHPEQLVDRQLLVRQRPGDQRGHLDRPLPSPLVDHDQRRPAKRSSSGIVGLDPRLGEHVLVEGVHGLLDLGRQPEPERRGGVDLGGVRQQRLAADVGVAARARPSVVMRSSWDGRSNHFSSKGDSMPSSSILSCIVSIRARDQTV